MKNAHRIEDDLDSFNGQCVCDSRWESNDCSHYVQEFCDLTCAANPYGLNPDRCHGPTARDCTVCVTNAYRSKTGECVCKPGWEDHDCSIWVGLCDPRCHECHGPTNADCDTCVANTQDLESAGNLCICDEDWCGPDCSYYKGECGKMCHGCHGPGNDNCEYCVEHAYKDVQGVCQCDPLWYTEWCNLPYETCHISCRTCDRTDNADLCLTCFGGFYLGGDGHCHHCHDNCATCTAASDSTCTKCHDGWYLDNGSCLMCDP